MNKKIGNPSQVCTAIRSQITDGRANGARIITVSNGRLNFVLTESNALDILYLWHEGMNIGFVSKNGYCTTDAGFMHNFPAGMLYTCGLDAIGGIEGHPLHGRFHSIPAEIIECKADENGVRIVGEIAVTALFGENLIVTRIIETKTGSDEITLSDTIRNEGFRDEKYCMLYHVNVGYPLVDEGAEIEGQIDQSMPRTDWAAKQMKKMLEMEAPEDGIDETCYFHLTDDGKLSLKNTKLGKRIEVTSNYKKFVEWKSRASGDYVIGLEPCSSWLDDELTYSILKPGAKVINKLSIKVENI